MLHEGLGELSDGGSDGFSDGLLGETGLSTGLLTEVSVIPSARSGVASAVATGSGVEADALVIFGGMVLDAQDDTTDSDSEGEIPEEFDYNCRRVSDLCTKSIHSYGCLRVGRVVVWARLSNAVWLYRLTARAVAMAPTATIAVHLQDFGS